MYDENENSFYNNENVNGWQGQTPEETPQQPFAAQETAAPQQPYTVQQTYIPPQAVEQPAPKKKKKRIGLKIAAACLACVIVGGAAGAGVMALTGRKPAAKIDLGDKARISGRGTITAQLPADTASPAGGSSAAPATVNVTLGASVATSPAVFETYTGNALSATEIYALGSQSVVGISTEIKTANIFGQESLAAVSGSGFVISKDGYILTNFHVVEDSSGVIEVKLLNGESYEAKVVGHEEDNDIAVLKIEAPDLVPVVLGSSENMQVGEMVYAIGNPLGELTYTMTHGMISALDREISTAENVSINMFQVDVAINSGNSGGPIFNSKGEVIGIVTAKYADTGVEGLGFAIPIDDAVSIAKELITHGYVTGKPFFGITVATVTEQAAAYYNMVPGAYVQAITEGSCAEKAGLKEGDIITKLGDMEVISSAELTAAKKHYKAGDTAELTVYRDGEYITVNVTFDEQSPELETEPEQEEEPEQPQQAPDQYGGNYGYGYGWNPFDIFGDIFGGYSGGWNPYGSSSYAG